MKHAAILTIVLVALATPCLATQDIPNYSITNEVRMIKPLTKGVELYCWKNADDEWNYALLIGTNVNKSDQTIRAPSHTITTLAGLKKRLAILAEGEQVTWGRNYQLPPEETQQILREFCASRTISLR